MNPILNEHHRRNRTTRSYWAEYAAHRELVTQSLLQAAPDRQTAASVCLLGAGNCNDVDLEQLAGVYEQIHLVDLDSEALAHAVDRVPDWVRRHLVAHPRWDASGVADEMDRWVKQAPTTVSYQRTIEKARTATIPLAGGPFDVVASCCLLSQLIDSLVLTGVRQDALFLQLLFAIRDRHLDLAWQSAKPGGTVIVISDFVSTATLPQLEHWTSSDLKRAFPQLIEERNFFTGTNPVAMASHFRQRPLSTDVEPSTVQPSIVGPWIWTVGKCKFGVCGVVARKGTE
jgi:hypothetical protein